MMTSLSISGRGELFKVGYLRGDGADEAMRRTVLDKDVHAN